MSIGAVLAVVTVVTSATQGLVVAGFAHARRRAELMWFALGCFAAVGYSSMTLVLVSPNISDFVVAVCGHGGLFFAALYVWSAMRFGRARRAVLFTRWQRAVEVAVIALHPLAFVPGLFYSTEPPRRFYVEAMATHYRAATPTPGTLVAYGVIAAGLLVTLKLLWQSAASRKARVAHVGAGVVFFALAINDMAAGLELVDTPFLGQTGFLIVLLAVSFDLAEDWGEEARHLTHLRRVLELRVEEGTTALTQAERKLSETKRLAAVGRLAAGVGHEINNPLTYVIGNLRELREAPDLPPEITAARLDEALEGADRIANIVSELRVLARREEVSSAPVDLTKVVNAAVRLTRHKLTDKKRVVLDVRVHAYVSGDAQRLTQALINLVRNAIEALPDDGTVHHVTVALDASEDTVTIRVKDDGIGIPADVIGGLFEPFFSTRRAGLGLGLAITQGIVTEAGGIVEVDSQVGDGTVFTLSFPRVAPGPDSQPVPSAPTSELEPASRRRLEGARVLVVDDEPLVVRVVSRMLKPGHVETAANGEEALEWLRSERFDCVVCDLMMPGLTGLELWRDLSDRAPSIAERFVFMTGGACDDAMRVFLESGEVPYLSKPVNQAELVAAVGRIVAATVSERPPAESPLALDSV